MVENEKSHTLTNVTKLTGVTIQCVSNLRSYFGQGRRGTNLCEENCCYTSIPSEDCFTASGVGEKGATNSRKTQALFTYK